MRVKKKICGLPTVLSDKAQTIEFSMVDQIKQLEIVLSFSIFFDQDAISQSVRVINHNNQDIVIEKIISANFSFLDDQFDCLSLNGAWGRECHLNRKALNKGILSLIVNVEQVVMDKIHLLLCWIMMQMKIMEIFIV